MRVLVVGAGAWGTAVAIHIARRHAVWLHARDPALAERLVRERVNARYLPAATLPETMHVGASLDAAVAWLAAAATAAAEPLLIVGTTVAGLRGTLGELRSLAAGRLDGVPLVWLCKGIEAGGGSLPHEIAAQAWPEAGGAALSGPSFAQEVAAGLPVALTVASRAEAPRAAAVRALHHDAARIYRSDDIVGVEVGGALKNVMAIAAGIADGLALGHNARAALITRGLAEIARFGVARGARPETFMGLTGLGDLVLTCTGDLSRNRRVGLGLAAGQPLAAVLAGLGHVAEGVPCTEEVVRQAARHRVEVPIAAAVGAVLAGSMRPREAVLALLAREPRDESDRRQALA